MRGRDDIRTRIPLITQTE